MNGRVLIVAGSDSGGGAGIQADIKTVTALGGYAATAITALTAQDTTGVHGIHEVPVDFIRQQMQLVLGDIGADCIKTGMLHSAQVIEAVVDVLETDAPDVPLVADPVMVAKGGASLLQDHAVDALRSSLLRRATVLTPNIPEAEVLIGGSIKTVGDMRSAAKALMAMGAQSVLLKGGHLAGDALTDVLATPNGEHVFESRRIDSVHTHGTGCTLASAIAAGLAQGLPPYDAVARARDYVIDAIKTAPGLGTGHGPLNHAHPFE
ncbi:MAG: bifunctional hydroxymethylpyrimidine kinase/phosphomethylpyrimidine kinase [Alphaproteobacteria bacterium]